MNNSFEENLKDPEEYPQGMLIHTSF